MNIATQAKSGFFYRLKLVDRHGHVIDQDEAMNIVPSEGLEAMQAVLFNGAVAPGALHVGIYSGEYTPTADITAATLPGVATEFTGYSGYLRPQFVPGPAQGGFVSNEGQEVEFAFTSSASIYGGFISTAGPKGATSGTLWSVVRFPSPKPASAELKLLVTAGFVLIS